MTPEMEIFVADDDPGHARLVEKNLRRAGFQNRIRRFEDGQQIVDYLLSHSDHSAGFAAKPCLLFLDIRMPKLDGVEVLRRIRADPELRRLPVTMLTTTEDPDEVNRCYELGCSNYVVKPVSYDKFAEAIQRLGQFLHLLQVPLVVVPETSGG